jgi:hypothetical protein
MLKGNFFIINAMREVMMKKSLLVITVLFLIAASPVAKHSRFTNADFESEFPSIVWNGSMLGVTWMDGRDGNQEVYFRTNDMSTGAPGRETRVTSSADWDDHPKLCWTGSEFGLSWIHESKNKFSLMFRRMDASGGTLGSAKTLIRGAHLGKDTVITSTGAGYGIITSEFKGSTGVSDLVFRYIDETGKQQGDAVTITSGPGVKTPANMVVLGSDFGLFYLNASNDSVNFQKIDPFGNPRGSALQLNLPGTKCGVPVAATNGKLTVAVWPQNVESGQEIMVALLDGNGNLSQAPFSLTTPGTNRPNVAVASGPRGFGVAWMGINDEGRALYFKGLGLNGHPNSEEVRLSKPSVPRLISNSLDMTTDHTGYVIAWTDVAPPANSEIILSKIDF